MAEKFAAMTAAIPAWRSMARAPRLAGRGLVLIYRYTLSPLVGFHCRHLPTCSEYADTALDRFGLWAGGWMTLARLCRCHPFGTCGLDFVPDSWPPGAHWYLPWRYGRWSGRHLSTPEDHVEHELGEKPIRSKFDRIGLSVDGAHGPLGE